jgi:hypothetical protein
MTTAILLLMAAMAPGSPGPHACGGNERAMMHAALLAEAEFAIRHESAKCIAASQGAQASDPSDAVLFALRKRLRVPIVGKSRAGDCKQAVHIWVSEPWCSNSDVASVSSGYHQHCGYAVLRERGRFVAHPPLVCE